jgi:hypothetical protein
MLLPQTSNRAAHCSRRRHSRCHLLGDNRQAVVVFFVGLELVELPPEIFDKASAALATLNAMTSDHFDDAGLLSRQGTIEALSTGRRSDGIGRWHGGRGKLALPEVQLIIETIVVVPVLTITCSVAQAKEHSLGLVLTSAPGPVKELVELDGEGETVC